MLVHFIVEHTVDIGLIDYMGPFLKVRSNEVLLYVLQ